MNTTEPSEPVSVDDLNADHWALIDAILEINIRRKKLGNSNLERLLEILDKIELEKKGV